MVLKIKKREKKGEYFEYKSSKILLTSKDIESADRFDASLNKTLKKIESILLKRKILSSRSKKKDPLQVWYIVGKQVNKFLKKHKVSREDENLFWSYLYGRSPLIHKGVPSSSISQTRNDFRTASLLAQYPYKVVKTVGPWALWREILTYKSILNDERVFKWVIKRLVKVPRTRDAARPLLKAVNNRLKRIDTTVLNDNELLEKLKQVKG